MVISLIKTVAFLLLNIAQLITLVRSTTRVVRRARFA